MKRRFLPNFVAKNPVTKFQKSSIWDDSFKEFSVGYVMVCSILSEDAVFMEKFAKRNGHFLTFKFYMGKVEIHRYSGCKDGGLIKKSRILPKRSCTLFFRQTNTCKTIILIIMANGSQISVFLCFLCLLIKEWFL